MNQGLLGEVQRDAVSTPWAVTPLHTDGGPVTGSVPGVGVTTTAQNTLTAWTEVIASAAADSGIMWIEFIGLHVSGADTSTLLDIGVGAPGSETVLIDGIPFYGHNAITSLMVPIRIAAGTRISARVQSNGLATFTVNVRLTPEIPGFPTGTSAAVVGTQNRAVSTYSSLTWGASEPNDRRTGTWNRVGTWTGKAIWLLPWIWRNGSTIVGTIFYAAFGSDTDQGATHPGMPARILVDDISVYCSTVEDSFATEIPFWLPDGDGSGALYANIDANQQSFPMAALVVVE